MEYNGYSNRETWLFNNYFGNKINDITDFEIHKMGLSIEYDRMTDGMLKDMIDFKLIDWEELHQLYTEQFKDEENKNEVKLYLSNCSRCRNVETEKSYALKWRDFIVHIPKSQCKMEQVEITGDSLDRWHCTIPNWLIEKNEDLKEIVNYLKTERNEKV
tara:strand:- start:241 stop:717 length:477 start_codon:yes stop_codon:yes gene_type:complete